MSDIESIIVLLLERTDELIIQEAKFLNRVHHQLQLMKIELEKFRYSLKDADANQDEDEGLKYWLKDVRDVVYRAEDAINIFSCKTAPLSHGGRFIGTIKRIALEFTKLLALYELRSKLNIINENICRISSRWLIDGPIHQGGAERSASSESYDQSNPTECRLSSFLTPEPDFVGFKEELETLMEQLTQEEHQQLCVVSVFGMPGLGKTTLARKAYNNNAIKSHFGTCAWVYVSEHYSVRGLLLQAIAEFCIVSPLGSIESLPDSELRQILFQKWEKNKSILSTLELLESLTDIELRQILIQKLEKTRYLIILDDLWEGRVWDNLKDTFPDTGNGSRILLTTRSTDIAELADSERRIHLLPFFRRHESWQLFWKKAFSRQHASSSSDLEEVGRKVLSKCQGVPLAIVIIGGLLSRKDPQEWKNLNESIKPQWDEEDQVSDILSLSWKDLPYYLRPCFSYMCNFPENYMVRAKKLIQLWQAEEMLQPKGDKTEEQVGEEFLMELVQRSMVNIVTKTSTSGIKTCRTHNLVRKLGASKAPAFESLPFSRFTISDSPNACRLFLYNCNIDSLFSQSDTTASLRTLLWLSWIPSGVELRLTTDRLLPSKVINLKLLGVLDFEGATISELPSEIDQLIHLRYLGLRRTLLTRLPRSARNLRNLQTLDVKYTCINQIPDAIRGMPRLRHLHVNRAVGAGNSDLIESLKDLQTISMMPADAWMEKGLSKLVKLRKLGIKGDFSFCSDSLSRLSKLESLRVVLDFGNTALDWESLPNNLAKLHLDRHIEKLPPENEFPQNLVKLSLRWSLMDKDHFAILQSFQYLRVLVLGRGSFIGKKMVFSPGRFSRLEVLRLDQLNDLEEWSIEKGALSCLVSLVIRSCRRLRDLPEGLQYVVATLKLFETELMTDEFKFAVRRHPIIKDIPSIKIN